MCLLLETIRIDQGIALHPEWHEERMSRSVRELWGRRVTFSIDSIIRVPGEFRSGTARCNILYGPEIAEITYKPYLKKVIRSLKLVICDTIDYALKYADRSRLEELLKLRGECDEILIVRNGMITDTSFSNVIFVQGERWITPDRPLLNGTCRKRLLSEGKITERPVTVADLTAFSGIRMINAMRDPREEETIPISRISG